MSFLENARDALRLATWRAPKALDAAISPLAIVGIFAAAILVSAAAQLFVAGGAGGFSPYGINAAIAAVAIHAAVILMFARVDRYSATVRNLMLVYIVSFIIALTMYTLVHTFAPEYSQGRAGIPAIVGGWLLMLAWFVWMIGSARRAFEAAPKVRRPVLRGFAFALVYMVSAMALPSWPVFAPKDFNVATANAWEAIKWYAHGSAATDRKDDDGAARRAAEAKAARVEARQAVLLDAAVGAMEPRDPTTANVFVVGVAGWSDQDVFMRETQQSIEILSSRFHLGKRTLSLVNNEATSSERPMASMQNLGAALRAVASRMDRDKDVLVLTMTSHGSKDGFALSYNHFVWRTLDPQTLKALLDEAGIKNRILIVSSCYSGTFIAPFADPDTMILTAASSTRTSFGCANERKWTYFGEAFFEKGLADNITLADAFVSAKATIAKWEGEQKLTPSDPQIFVGDQIARRFPELIGEAPLAAAHATDTEPERVKSE